ncbi:hypothetical protein [Nocardioides sp. SYSU DS0663]|uniref:hypothetical protein n=1 Tax=Nocardioides sp. SYSU DS0663 TaxID=3416445 RepID=UPI003F4C9AB9
MGAEEYLADVDRRWEAAKQRFEGAPLPRVSRVKREDHPHLERVGWAFQVRDGAPVWVLPDGERGEVHGRVRGLRPVEDDGPPALLVELPTGAWALRRAGRDGTWDVRGGEDSVLVADREIAVVAWPVPSVPGDPASRVPGPGRAPRAWRASTAPDRREWDR